MVSVLLEMSRKSQFGGFGNDMAFGKPQAKGIWAVQGDTFPCSAILQLPSRRSASWVDCRGTGERLYVREP